MAGSSPPRQGLGGVQHPTPAYPRCQNPRRTLHRSSFPFSEPPAARLRSGGLPVGFGQLLKFNSFHVQTLFATSANYTQVFQSSAQGGLSESFPSTFPPCQEFSATLQIHLPHVTNIRDRPSEGKDLSTATCHMALTRKQPINLDCSLCLTATPQGPWTTKHWPSKISA